MRNLLIIVAMLIYTIATAQSRQDENYAWVSVGSVTSYEPTSKESLDKGLAVGAQIKVGAIFSNIEIALVYANSPKIDFQQGGVQVNLVTYLMRNFDLVTGLEGGGINRVGNSNHFYAGANAELRYNINDYFLVGLQANYRLRKDTEYFYNSKSSEATPSVMINAYLKLN